MGPGRRVVDRGLDARWEQWQQKPLKQLNSLREVSSATYSFQAMSGANVNEHSLKLRTAVYCWTRQWTVQKRMNRSRWCLKGADACNLVWIQIPRGKRHGDAACSPVTLYTCCAVWWCTGEADVRVYTGADEAAQRGWDLHDPLSGPPARGTIYLRHQQHARQDWTARQRHRSRYHCARRVTVLYTHTHARYTHTHTHTHTRLMALFPGLPGWAGTEKR